MTYVLIFVFGTLLGIVISTVMMSSGNSSVSEESYSKGFDDGKKFAMGEMNK